MSRRPLVLLGLFVLMSVLTRGWLVRVEVVDSDEAAHLVGSWQVMAGRMLYTDFADNKPPLLYADYAVAQAVFGRGMLAVRLFTILLTVPLTALAVSAFWGHRRRGAIAGVTWLVAGAAYLAHDMQAVNCELLLVLPAAWALVVARDETRASSAPHALAFGALVGLASLFKQPALAWLPAPALALLVLRRPRDAARAGVVAMLAAIVPWLIAWALFAAHGGAEGFVYWNLTHNLSYVANPLTLAEASRRIGTMLLPFLLATAPLWWMAGRGLRSIPTYGRALLVAVIVLSIPMVIAGGRLFPHYFVPLYVPLALAAAPWLDAACRTPWPRRARLAVGGGVVLLVGFGVVDHFLYYGPRPVYQETRPEFAEVAARLRADPCAPNATLFVWGSAPEFYTATAMTPASRFVVPQASLTGYVPGNRRSVDEPGAFRALIRPEHWDLLMDDLERNRATFVLDTAPSGIHHWDRYPVRDFPRLLAYLTERYDAAGVVDGVVIWRRRGCAS